MSDRGRRILVAGGLLAVALALLIAALMAYLDWRLNPGGIFHGPGGTRWDVLLSTAWSWFWPVLLLGAAVAASIAALGHLRRKS